MKFRKILSCHCTLSSGCRTMSQGGIKQRQPCWGEKSNETFRFQRSPTANHNTREVRGKSDKIPAAERCKLERQKLKSKLLTNGIPAMEIKFHNLIRIERLQFLTLCPFARRQEGSVFDPLIQQTCGGYVPGNRRFLVEKIKKQRCRNRNSDRKES